MKSPSLYLRRISHGGPLSERDYRQTPAGERRVEEIIKIGDWIESSYNTRGVIIHSSPKVICACGQDHEISIRLSDNCAPLHCCSLTYVSYGDLILLGEQGNKILNPSRLHHSKLSTINELVAVEGRILHLMAENNDEVFIQERPPGIAFHIQQCFMLP